MLFLKEARSRLYDSEKLSNLELLTLISNNEGLALHVYQIIGGDLTNLTRETLNSVSGLGETLVSRLLAAVQLGYHTRLQAAERNQITSPHDAAQILIPCFAGLEQEHLRVLCLDTKNRVIVNELIYKGNVNSSIIRSSEVFRPAIVRTCPSIIIAHNHPSSEISASPVIWRKSQIGELPLVV